MRQTILLLILTVATFQSFAGTGRELHVAKSGHANGDGSKQHPFVTISHAAREARPGDVVIIHAGIYREQVTLSAGGLDEKTRIVFMAARGGNVVVKGSEQITSWKKENGSIWTADIPAGLFKGYNPFVRKIYDYHTAQLFIDDKLCKEQLPGTNHITKGAWVAEVKDNGNINIRANFGALNPNQRIVEISLRPAAFIAEKPGINYITLDGLTISQVANDTASINAEQPGAIATGGGLFWNIQYCGLSDITCAGITLSQPGGRDMTRNGPGRPAFGEFEDINAVGHHIIRNNVIRRCGQAGIFGVLHGTCSNIQDNIIEDINSNGLFKGDEASGIYLAVAVDAIVQHNLIRRVRGSGITLGPLYQGTRLSRNIVMDIQGSPLHFFRSHGFALIDKNIIVGPAKATEEIKLRSAEANVFIQNLFVDCVVTNEPLPPGMTGGTINYRPHSLITKQTIPATTLDNKWFANIFIRGGLDKVREQTNTEAEYNIYLNGAKSTWGDTSSKVVQKNIGFKLSSAGSTADIAFDLTLLPAIKSPAIDAQYIGRFALSGDIEEPNRKPVMLNTDFFGNSSPSQTIGPFAKYRTGNTKTVRLFERIVKKEALK
jgi:hypothetical protein